MKNSPLAWADLDLPLSSASNEACKLYDAALTQYVTLYNDPNMGGVKHTTKSMLEADPDFLMGHVIVNGFELMGGLSNTLYNSGLQSRLDTMTGLSLKQNEYLSVREWKHAKAVELYGAGKIEEACATWEEILLYHPTDMLALRFLYFAYTFIGLQPEVRDCFARVMPYWNQDMHLYPSLLGMYAFGLVETNYTAQAEKVAQKGLLLDRHESSSTHSMAHVFENMGREEDGIAFMKSTVQDWDNGSAMLSGHINWHWALYYIEKGNYERALDIYDSKLHDRCTTKRGLVDMIDSTSVLYRLEMEGVNIESRWNDIYEVCKSHIGDHTLAFHDTHILMSCLGAKQKETSNAMMESIQEYIKLDLNTTNQRTTREVGAPLCKALIAYDEEDFAKATNILYPLRYKVLSIGRSNAQRDVFNLFLIQAAMKSPKREHVRLSQRLIAERKALKENSPLTDRLMAKVVACHVD